MKAGAISEAYSLLSQAAGAGLQLRPQPGCRYPHVVTPRRLGFLTDCQLCLQSEWLKLHGLL